MVSYSFTLAYTLLNLIPSETDSIRVYFMEDQWRIFLPFIVKEEQCFVGGDTQVCQVGVVVLATDPQYYVVFPSPPLKVSTFSWWTCWTQINFKICSVFSVIVYVSWSSGQGWVCGHFCQPDLYVSCWSTDIMH